MHNILAFKNTNCLSLQMAVYPIHAFLAPSAPVLLMAPTSVASAHLATLGMALPARTLMSVKRSLMPATHITGSIAVRTLSQVITVCLVPHATLVLSPLEEEWSKPPLKNRFELLLIRFARVWAHAFVSSKLSVCIS